MIDVKWFVYICRPCLTSSSFKRAPGGIAGLEGEGSSVCSIRADIVPDSGSAFESHARTHALLFLSFSLELRHSLVYLTFSRPLGVCVCVCIKIGCRPPPAGTQRNGPTQLNMNLLPRFSIEK